jgi:hypothetical protein
MFGHADCAFPVSFQIPPPRFLRQRIASRDSFDEHRFMHPIRRPNLQDPIDQLRAGDPLGAANGVENVHDVPGAGSAQFDGLVSHEVWAGDAVDRLMRRACQALASEFGLMARRIK